MRSTRHHGDNYDGDEDVDGDFFEKCKFLHGVVNIALRYNQPSKTGPAQCSSKSYSIKLSHHIPYIYMTSLQVVLVHHFSTLCFLLVRNSAGRKTEISKVANWAN